MLRDGSRQCTWGATAELRALVSSLCDVVRERPLHSRCSFDDLDLWGDGAHDEFTHAHVGADGATRQPAGAASAAQKREESEQRAADVSLCAEEKPQDAISNAMEKAMASLGPANAAKAAAVPKYREMSEEMREKWEGEQLVKECFLVPSEALATWDVRKRAAVARDLLKGECSAQTQLAREPVLRVLVTGAGMEEEFHVLPSTKLEALRRAVFCKNDHTEGGRGRYENYCFLVEGVFYCGTKYAAENPSRYVDLAGPIIEWARITGAGEFTAVDVGNLTFGSMETLEFSKPYLFLHQGDCEHRMEIISAHLASDHDPPDKNDYPMLVFSSRPKRTMCMGCSKAWPRYECYGHKMHENPDHPLLLCHRCFRFAFYGEDDKVLEEYQSLRVIPIETWL